MHILFLCTGNSCRSIIAEGVFNALAPNGLTAESAGSNPAGYIHPLALTQLEKHGIATDGFSSKSWDILTTKPDIVITLCSDAAQEACPLYLGDVTRAHWGLPDPASVDGDAKKALAFDRTYEALHSRIQDFFRLPLLELATSRAKLKQELDAIAQRHANL